MSKLFDMGQRITVKVEKPRILVIGDTHMPFADISKLDSVLHLAKDLKPNVIVQIGDLYDLYTFSRFARSVDLTTPAAELEDGRKHALAFWEALTSKSPKSLKFQLRGNHSHRIVKNLLARAPEYESLLAEPIAKLTEFPGVQDMKSARSELEINGILFVHGWSTRPGFHRDYFGQSVVHGHTHHLGLSWKAQKGVPLFELDCGHIADVNKLPLQYGESKTTSWVAGAGFIDEYGPRTIIL